MIQGIWKMGNEDIAPVIAVRETVFGDAGAKDMWDDFAMHCVMVDTDTEEIVATGRLYRGERNFCLDKVCCLEAYRGQYVADLMVRLMLFRASQFADKIELTAGKDVTGYFARYGFKVLGEDENSVNMLVNKNEIRFPSKCGEDCAVNMIED